MPLSCYGGDGDEHRKAMYVVSKQAKQRWRGAEVSTHLLLAVEAAMAEEKWRWRWRMIFCVSSLSVSAEGGDEEEEEEEDRRKKKKEQGSI
jgi:hypothetical protein